MIFNSRNDCKLIFDSENSSLFEFVTSLYSRWLWAEAQGKWCGLTWPVNWTRTASYYTTVNTETSHSDNVHVLYNVQCS